MRALRRPGRRVPVELRPRRHPRDRLLPRRPDRSDPEGDRLHPGELLGCVSGELGLRTYLRAQGHELVVTADKDGPDSEFERHLADAEIVISQPFWPAYLTAERIAKAPNLKLAITAGIGSDHVDLQAAMDAGITVAEVTYCNSICVAEHVVMMILGLVRNYIPSHQIVLDGGWNIADAVARSYDLEGMQVGTVAAGRIGLARAAPPAALRRRPALHGPPPPARRGRGGTGRDPPRDGREPGRGLRRGDDQLPAAPGDRRTSSTPR